MTTIYTGARQAPFATGYRGRVTVSHDGGKYSYLTEPVRLSRADAKADARAEAEHIALMTIGVAITIR